MQNIAEKYREAVKNGYNKTYENFFIYYKKSLLPKQPKKVTYKSLHKNLKNKMSYETFVKYYTINKMSIEEIEKLNIKWWWNNKIIK